MSRTIFRRNFGNFVTIESRDSVDTILTLHSGSPEFDIRLLSATLTEVV